MNMNTKITTISRGLYRVTLIAAATLGVMSVVASCSSESADSEAESVMLEAKVSDIAQTRDAIDDSTLPSGANYGLYIIKNGKVVSNNIKMNTNSSATGYDLTYGQTVQVGAYYPYDEKASASGDITIQPGSTDYLHNVSSGNYTRTNSTAYITLYHALARVKFNISVVSNVSSCDVEVSSIDNVFKQARMRLLNDNVDNKNGLGVVQLPKPIKGTVKGGETVSAEVLVIPQTLTTDKPSVKVSIDKDVKNISDAIVKATASGRWESGKVYTYNITVSESKNISVAQCVIENWGTAVNKGNVTVSPVE